LARNVPTKPDCGEIGRERGVLASLLNIKGADAIGAETTRQARASGNRNRFSVFRESDSATEEQDPVCLSSTGQSPPPRNTTPADPADWRFGILSGKTNRRDPVLQSPNRTLGKRRIDSDCRCTRLTGRFGAYSIGALNIQQRSKNTSLATNFTAIRLRRNILANSDVGLIFLNKDADGPRYNRVIGTDANFRFF